MKVMQILRERQGNKTKQISWPNLSQRRATRGAHSPHLAWAIAATHSSQSLASSVRSSRVFWFSWVKFTVK